MAATSYHQPNDIEMSFLRLVTRGYPELELQIEDSECVNGFEAREITYS